MNRVVIAALVAAVVVGASHAKIGAPYATEFRGSADVTFKTPSEDVLYPCGRLVVPAGSWKVSYRVMVYSSRPSSDTGTVSAFARLVGAGLSGPDWTTGGRVGGNSYRGIWTLNAEGVVTLNAKTTLVLAVYQSEGGNWDQLQCLGGRSTTIIRAEKV